MSFADQVREYCYETYILPAIKSNKQTFEIKTGDVHKALNYKNRYPLVCSAIAMLRERGQSYTFDNFPILDTLPQQAWHVGGDR